MEYDASFQGRFHEREGSPLFGNRLIDLTVILDKIDVGIAQEKSLDLIAVLSELLWCQLPSGSLTLERDHSSSSPPFKPELGGEQVVTLAAPVLELAFLTQDGLESSLETRFSHPIRARTGADPPHLVERVDAIDSVGQDAPETCPNYPPEKTIISTIRRRSASERKAWHWPEGGPTVPQGVSRTHSSLRLVGMLGVGAFGYLRDQLRMALLQRGGDVLKEDGAQDDVLLLGGVRPRSLSAAAQSFLSNPSGPRCRPRWS